MKINEFIPPVVLDLALRLRILKGNCVGRFNSFEAASLSITNEGYQDDALCQSIVNKTIKFRDFVSNSEILSGDIQLMRVLLAISLVNSHKLKVIDFGGASGYHYFLAKKFFNNQLSFDWRVVETPKLATLSRQIQTNELQFFDELEDACKDSFKPDLVFSSGALQFIPKLDKLLSDLSNLQAKIYYITRIPVADIDKSIITMQLSKMWHNGPSVPGRVGKDNSVIKYPVSLFSRKEIQLMFGKYFRIDAEFFEESASYRLENLVFDMYGYLLKVK